VSQYQKGKTNLDFTEARDSEWHQLDRLHLAADRQPRQQPTTLFLQAGFPSCHPTNSVKALKAESQDTYEKCQTWQDAVYNYQQQIFLALKIKHIALTTKQTWHNNIQVYRL